MRRDLPSGALLRPRLDTLRWHDACQLFRPTARVRIHEQRGMGENEAYLDQQSGKIYWHSEFGDNDEELPDDIDDEKYILIPDKIELDLGKPLVLDFAR